MLYHNRVVAGFAGTAADAFTLFSRFEGKLEEHRGNLPRAAVELAKDWRSDRVLRRLEAMLAVADREHSFIVSGNGDVIEPDDGLIGIGSGGPYALAAARALIAHADLDAKAVVDGGHAHRRRRSASTRTTRSRWNRCEGAAAPARAGHEHAHPRPDRRGARPLHRRARTAPSARWPWPCATAGAARTSRGAARRGGAQEHHHDRPHRASGRPRSRGGWPSSPQAPFVKVEASKYTEVGYVGRDVESIVRDLDRDRRVHGEGRAARPPCRTRPSELAEERLLDILLPRARPRRSSTPSVDGR